jgi:hypothetical protein
MRGRDRDYVNPRPVPALLKCYDEELEALLWVTSSLAISHRIKSCKRRDVLVLELTEMLDGPCLSNAINDRSALVKCQVDLKIAEVKIKDLQYVTVTQEGQLAKAESHFESRLDDEVTDQVNDRVRPIRRQYVIRTVWICVLYTILISVLFIYLQFFYSWSQPIPLPVRYRHD